MPQINDSQVTHPTIVFQVDLETVDRTGHLVPNRVVVSGNETVTEADDQRNHRTIFIPGITAAENRVGLVNNGLGTLLRHGDQFTLKGGKATYVKNTFTTGDNPPLLIVSEN